MESTRPPDERPPSNENPEQHIEERTVAGFPAANVGRRIIAGLIDVLIAYGLIIPIYRFAAFGSVARWALVPYLLPCIYLLLKEAFRGQSVGKFIAGLVCYNTSENKRAGIVDSIIRNWFLAIIVVPPRVVVVNLGMFLFALLALVILMQILLGQKQRIGDRWANTQVIDARLLQQRED